MDRPYLYHVLDDESFGSVDNFGSVSFPVPINSRRPTSIKESKQFYSLVRDFQALREEGASKGIVDPGILEVGKSSRGRTIPALKVGKGARHKVLFTGAHHSREWISVEIPYYVAEYLIRNYKEEPTNYKERLLKKIVDTRTIWFVPMVNPDGHAITTSENRMWRANHREISFPEMRITRHWTSDGILRPVPTPGGRTEVLEIPAGSATGVDINRNYPTNEWGVETGKDGLSPHQPESEGRRGK